MSTRFRHAPSDFIIVPDAHLLFHGDFKRSGVDLILADGELVRAARVLQGREARALASPDGAHLTGDIVNALTGYTQFAQADVAQRSAGHRPCHQAEGQRDPRSATACRSS